MINFDVKAQMEEKERRGGLVTVGFALTMGTKPNVVKYVVEGVATLDGRDEDVKSMLEIDPETQTPRVFQRVYQHIFMSIYLLSTLIDAPYPPPNLMGDQQQEAVMQMMERFETSRKESEKTETVVMPEEKVPISPASAESQGTNSVQQEEKEAAQQ